MEQFRNTISICCVRGMMTCIETLRTWIISTKGKCSQLKLRTQYLERCHTRMKDVKNVWTSFRQRIREDTDTTSLVESSVDMDTAHVLLVRDENRNRLPDGANKTEGKLTVSNNILTTNNKQKKNKKGAQNGTQFVKKKEDKLLIQQPKTISPNTTAIHKSSNKQDDSQKPVPNMFKMPEMHKSRKEQSVSPNTATQFTFNSPVFATKEMRGKSVENKGEKSPTKQLFSFNASTNRKMWIKQNVFDSKLPTDETHVKATERKGGKSPTKKQRLSPNNSSKRTFWFKQEVPESGKSPTDEAYSAVNQTEETSPTKQPSSPSASAKRTVWMKQEVPECDETPTQEIQKTVEDQSECKSPNNTALTQNHVTLFTGKEDEQILTDRDMSTDEEENPESYAETGVVDNVAAKLSELKVISRFSPKRKQRRRTTNSDSRTQYYPLASEKHPKAFSTADETYSSQYFDEYDEESDTYSYFEDNYQCVSETKTQKMKNKFTTTHDDGSEFCSIIKGRLRTGFGDMDVNDDDEEEEDENSKGVQVNLDGESDSPEVGSPLTTSEPSSVFSNVRAGFEIATYRMDDRVEEQRGVKGVRVNVPQGKVKRRGVANKHLEPQKPSFKFERLEHWDEELLPAHSDRSRNVNGDKADMLTGTIHNSYDKLNFDDVRLNEEQNGATEGTPDRKAEPDIRHYCEVPVKVLQKKTTDDDLVAAYGGSPRGKKNKVKGRRRDRKSTSGTRSSQT